MNFDFFRNQCVFEENIDGMNIWNCYTCNHCPKPCPPPCPPPEDNITSLICLATHETVNNNQWLGLGETSPLVQFEKSTIVIPAGSRITGIILNTRDNSINNGQTVKATIYTSPCGFAAPVSTGISATVTGSTTTKGCCASSTSNYLVNTCSLLSVKIELSTGTGALSSGAAVTILVTPPTQKFVI